MIESFEEQIVKKTDKELTDIFIEYNKYQKEFIDFVEVELRRRNIPVETILELRNKNDQIKDESLTQGEQGSPVWIAIGFIAPVIIGFVSTFGGVFSVFLGYSYAYSKRMYNKKEYFVYNVSTRQYGKYMFFIYLSIIIFELYRNFILA